MILPQYGYNYETGNTARWWKNVSRVPKSITIHHWGSRGSSFDGIISWFCKTNDRQTSANYVAQGANADGSVSKRVACIVDPDKIAYHAGNWQANVDSIGIECRPEARDLDYVVVAELVARLWIAYGVLPLYKHSHWVSTDCPGVWDIAKVSGMALKIYNDFKSGTVAPVTPSPTKGNPVPNLDNSDLSNIANAVWGRPPFSPEVAKSVGSDVASSSAANNLGWQTVYGERILAAITSLNSRLAAIEAKIK